MLKKIPICELYKMNSKQLGGYITDITQTPICKDDLYCKKLIEIWRSKPFNFYENEVGQMKFDF